MTIFKHEMRQCALPLLIWTTAIASMIALCILIYPEMSSDMGNISALFADMGAFSAAFGMDRLNFGEFVGFFGVECGNILGLGGAFFAALTGILALAKEEREHTAEFLLTHPVSRARIVSEKLLSVIVQILALNAVVVAVTALSLAAIDESADHKSLALLFLSYLFLQLETGAICFGISAFLRRGGLGIGLGLAAVFYFVNIISNLTEGAKALKYLTPFGYTDSADILSNRALDMRYLAVGAILTVIGIAAAYRKYTEKDIT